MATPHNQAEKGQIAKTVLMPEIRCVQSILQRIFSQRYSSLTKCAICTAIPECIKAGSFCHGKRYGMPSMGIYSYELYTKYDVERIIRIGSAGALSDDIALMDIVAAIGTCTDSNYASSMGCRVHLHRQRILVC